MFEPTIFGWGNFVLILWVVRTPITVAIGCRSKIPTDPVTSVLPTQDSQTLLVATLDNHIRLMDSSTGKMLNDFTGHTNQEYRCRACYCHGEASVVCGDEKGQIWAWDLLDVRVHHLSSRLL